MDKIGEHIITAIQRRNNLKKQNTIVLTQDGKTIVRYYNSNIAVIDWTKSTVVIDDCGYATVSTTRRLNAVLEAFDLPQIQRGKIGSVKFSGKAELEF